MKSAMGESVEIRRNPDGSIDEIIAKAANIHIEQMDDTGFYMGLDMPDGSYWQFWFGSKNRKSHTEFRHTEMTTKAQTLEMLERSAANAFKRWARSNK